MLFMNFSEMYCESLSSETFFFLSIASNLLPFEPGLSCELLIDEIYLTLLSIVTFCLCHLI